MSGRCFAGVMLTLSIAAAPALAQSLGDVARAEEARRAAAPKAVKSYSNASLGPSAFGSAVTDATETDPSCYVSIKSGRCVTADEILANSTTNVRTPENASKEPGTRIEARSIREQLASFETEIDALVEQAENENLPAAKRKLAEDALAMKRPLFAHAQQRWARLEKNVNDMRLPHEWIEPVPPQVGNPQ